MQKESVQKRIGQLEQRFGGVKVIVGVDRLDYIKGVPQKLHALELFLSQHPEWIGKVRFCVYYLSTQSLGIFSHHTFLFCFIIKFLLGCASATRGAFETGCGRVSEFTGDCE